MAYGPCCTWMVPPAMSTLTAAFWPTSTAVLLSGGLDGVPREGHGSPISCLCLWEPTHKWRSSEQSWQTLQQSICTSELDLPTQNKTKLLILNRAADVVIDSLLVSFPREPQGTCVVGTANPETWQCPGSDSTRDLLPAPRQGRALKKINNKTEKKETWI